jgi:hypothetical protein
LDIALFDRIWVDFELLKIWCVCLKVKIRSWLWDSRPLDMSLWKILGGKTLSHWCAYRTECEYWYWATHSWFFFFVTWNYSSCIKMLEKTQLSIEFDLSIVSLPVDFDVVYLFLYNQWRNTLFKSQETRQWNWDTVKQNQKKISTKVNPFSIINSS